MSPLPFIRSRLVLWTALATCVGCADDASTAPGTPNAPETPPVPGIEAARDAGAPEPAVDGAPAVMEPDAVAAVPDGAGAEGAPPEQVADAGVTEPPPQPDAAVDGAMAAEGGDAGPGPAQLPTDISIWLAGDSTVAQGVLPCPIGWGAKFDDFFSDHVTVENVAVGGASVTNWSYHVLETMDDRGECELERGLDGEPKPKDRWQRVMDGMQPGDYLFIQFGINDGNRVCPYHAGLTAFAEVYGALAQAAKERGAQPVFVTPVSAIKCREGTSQPTRGAYVTTTFEAGETYDVPVLDLHQRSIDYYAERGFCPIPGGGRYITADTGGEVGAFFCDDNTHFSGEGAQGIASLVAAAVREQGLPLAQYLR